MSTPCWTPRRLASSAISSAMWGITLACTCPVRGLGCRPRLHCGSRATKPCCSPALSARSRVSADVSLRRVLRLARSIRNGWSLIHISYETLVHCSRKLCGILHCRLHSPLYRHGAQIATKLKEGGKRHALHDTTVELFVFKRDRDCVLSSGIVWRWPGACGARQTRRR